jgi:small basic protein (TIGR04137 family)
MTFAPLRFLFLQRMRLHSPTPTPNLPDHFYFMSQHPSLKGKSSISARRSVLKRFERVELLRKRGQFKDGQRVIGLPKTKPED